jgi:hypothetical protein
MVRAIVDNVTALAQALEVTPPVIARVVIEVCCGEDDVGLPHPRRFYEIGPAARTTATISPDVMGGIEPTPVRQTANAHTVGSAACLTDPGGPLEPDTPADLPPVDRVKSSHFRFDRHPYPLQRDGRSFTSRR